MMKRRFQPLNNQKGLLIIDFIFASVLFFVFASILFSFAVTFSVVEVFQYISYSSARAYTLAHQSEQIQEQRGQGKFEELAANPAVRQMISSGWFQIGDPLIGDFNDELASDDDRNRDSANFNGTRIPFTAPILYKRLPFLGGTGSGPDAFFTFIQSFTGREPTMEECQAFTNQRINGVATFYGLTDPGAYSPQHDNGC